MLRIDDMPQQVADDIHAFGVIWRETVEMFTKMWYNEYRKQKQGGKSYDPKRTMRSIA